jgi:HAD superfamily hydrolase (TIGR01490 family)
MEGLGAFNFDLPIDNEAGVRSAVFIDLDRTLIGGSSLFHFGRAAYRAGLLSKRQLASDAYANIKFRLVGLKDSYTDELKERVSQTLAGVPVSAVDRLMPDVLAGILPRIYPEMLAIAYAHQDAGRSVYICTAAAQAIAELLGSILGFDGAIGTKAEVVNGQYTGGIEGPFVYREGKAEVVREVCTREGFSLTDSWAYSDSESDVPLLRTVGNAVAVNPDSELAKIARYEEWEILHFDRIRSRLYVTAAIATAAIGAGIGSFLFSRRLQGGRA